MAKLTRDQLPPEMSNQISDNQLDLINWMMFYYEKPQPDEFPNWLKKASAEGMLKDEKRQFPFLGFATTIFTMNTERIHKWMNIIDLLPENDRKTVLISLWLSGTKASKDILMSESRQKLLYGQNYFNFDTNNAPPSLDNINIYWGFLDIQWGRFCASGNDKPIRNIISVLDYGLFMGAQKKYPQPQTDEEKEAIIKEIVFQSALWSLRSNCKIYPKVLEICENVYNEGNLSHIAQLSLKSILIELKPDKYHIEETSNKANSAAAKGRAAD
jgi:hypothetical protein